MRSALLLMSVLILFPVACPPCALHAKMPEVKVMKEEGPVEIEADHLIYEREQQRYEAHGQVEVKRGDLLLRADNAQLSQVTKDLAAWGNVVLREGENVIECERLEVNLDTRLGKIYQAKLFLKDQNYHVTGRELEKLGENVYRVRGGSFTTCDAERPPWKFTVKELDVTLSGSGIAKSPVFYIEDVPLLYLPMATFPVQRERHSGFLLPEVGYSSTYGAEVRTAFYWAIRKDMDATFYLSYLGDRGFKEGVEYRYAFARETTGQAKFYFINDQVYEGDRDAFFLRHTQKLPYDFYLKGDINYVSDNKYPTDFDEDLPSEAKIDSRSLRLLRSVLFGGKNWDQYSLLVDGRVYNDLTQPSNDTTVQQLPQVFFYAHPQSLFANSLFYDVTSSYTNFYREKGVEAQRFDLFPALSYPMRLFDVVKFEPRAGVRETFYEIRNDPTDLLQGSKNRLTFQAEAQVSAEWYRVYEGVFPKISQLFGVSKWMHTIEPSIAYVYNPQVNQEDIPIFDELDRIPYTNQILYGITQRLVGRPLKEGVDSGPREYARLSILQSYSFGDPLVRDERGNARYFSDILAELWCSFGSYLSGRVEVGFDPYDARFSQLNGLLTFKDVRSDAIQAEYRYTKDRVHEANVYGRLKTIPPLYLLGGVRYNLLAGSPVETFYGAQYQAQCWTLGATLNHIYESPDRTQRGETRFWVYLNLLGLGEVGRKPFFAGL